jgi:hypothetical protein
MDNNIKMEKEIKMLRKTCLLNTVAIIIEALAIIAVSTIHG